MVPASRPDPVWALAVLSLLGHFFAPLCHQMPSRSPHFAGVAFPVCFRMAGVYLGVLASYLYLAATGGWRRRLPDTGRALACAFAILPLLIDGWGNTLHFWSSPGPLRLLTGLGCGMVLPLLLVPLGQNGPQDPAPSLTSTLPHATGAVWIGLIGLGLTGVLLRPGSMAAFAVLGMAAAAGSALLLGNLIWAARPAGCVFSRREAVRYG